MENNNWVLCGDVHCRSFYKPVLQIKDRPVIFTGDYMDPYHYEGCTDEEGIVNLEEIFDFARKNKNVILLTGNHDTSLIWSAMGFERTYAKYYNELHRLYRDNIDLLHPIYKLGDVIFTHAGICQGWINMMNSEFEYKGTDFRLTEDNIIPYIENEFQLELQSDVTPNIYWGGGSLNSPIFCIGRSRGGDDAYGGPFWADFEYDHWNRPFNWNRIQICGHQQGDITGLVRTKDGIACVDSRAIFEYNPETHFIAPSQLNDEKTKTEIPKIAWKGKVIGFRKDSKEGE